MVGNPNQPYMVLPTDRLDRRLHCRSSFQMEAPAIKSHPDLNTRQVISPSCASIGPGRRLDYIVHVPIVGNLDPLAAVAPRTSKVSRTLEDAVDMVGTRSIQRRTACSIMDSIDIVLP